MRRADATEVRELVLLGTLLVFIAGLCLQPISESDLFFRLKVGSEILARHALLSRNLFSFTAPDHPDLDLSWGFEVAAALIFGVGGFPAVVAAKAMFIVATFAALFALCRRRGAGALSTTAALATAALVMRDRFVERPHVASFAGEVLVLAAIQALPLPGVWSWRRRAVFCLAMIAWANLHAGIFTGVFIALLAALGFWAGSRGGHRLAQRTLVLAGAITVAVAVTPVGPLGLARYLRLHLILPRIHAIDEFRAATWRSDWPFILLVAAATVLSLLPSWVARCRLAQRRAPPGIPAAPAPTPTLAPRLFELFPAGGMVVLGMTSVRFAADAALITAPLLALGLTVLVEQLPPLRWWRSRPGSTAATALVVAGVLALTVFPRVADARAGRRFIDLDLDVTATALPLEALRFVEANGLRERMYNDFEIGSYLLFEGYPRYRVFVDPRLPAYPEEMHRLLGSFDLDRAAWGAAMDRYGVQTALLAYAGINRRVAWWDPDQWALVFRAADSRVFVRRREQWRALIAAHEVPATFEFSVEQGATTLPLDVRPKLSPVTDCEWQRRLGELVFELDSGRTERAQGYFERSLAVAGCLAPGAESATAAWLGALEIQTPDPAHALTHLDRALALAPDDTRTRANRATALERLGRRGDAAADWAAVALQARGTPIGKAAAVRAHQLAGPTSLSQ